MELQSLIVRQQQDLKDQAAELERIQRVLHDIGEMLISPGWAYFKQELQDLCQINLARCTDKDQTWERICEVRGMRKVLDMERGFHVTKAALEEQYHQLRQRMMHAAQDHLPAPEPDYFGFLQDDERSADF